MGFGAVKVVPWPSLIVASGRGWAIRKSRAAWGVNNPPLMWHRRSSPDPTASLPLGHVSARAVTGIAIIPRTRISGTTLSRLNGEFPSTAW